MKIVLMYSEKILPARTIRGRKRYKDVVKPRYGGFFGGEDLILRLNPA